MPTVISITEVMAYYRDTLVLRVDELLIPSRGVTTFLGPSGCGKSTLLKIIANLLDPSLRFTGDLHDRGARRTSHAPTLPYAMIWQAPLLFPCSLYENLSIPLRKRGVSKLLWQEQIEAQLTTVGIIGELGTNWAQIHAHELSGGQQQRICIARGLLQDAQLFLFDEPCSNLDPHNADIVENVILELGKSIPAIMVTHNLGFARRISDYAAVFCRDAHSGYMCEAGPKPECLFRPSTTPAQKFLLREQGL